MTNLQHRTKAAAIATVLGLTTVGLGSQAAIAQVFTQKEVPQDRYVLMASPYGQGAYSLLIVEQITDQRKCWSESGSNPVLVDPLLLQFDFTGICGRSTDSNGYSIRMGGKDFGLFYTLRVVRTDNDLVLIGQNQQDRNAPILDIARANGLPPSGKFAKFVLQPGWRLTRRATGDQVLGHVYLTRNDIPTGVAVPYVFADVQKHWAKEYIEALAARGIISGFEDGSFRPEAPVTRVQYAAMINKAFASAPSRRGSTTFQDVAANYWGYQAIQAAYQKGFMSGYPEGTFKPDLQIPKLEVLLALSSGLNLSSTNTSILSFYSDASQIPDWAKSAIAGVTEKRVVVNYPRVKELSPTRNATRAEVAAMIYQALVSAGQVPNIASPYIVIAN